MQQTQKIFPSNAIQTMLFEEVIKPYKTERQFRRRDIHIKSCEKLPINEREHVVIYTQRWFGHDLFGKKRSIILIDSPYLPNNVTVLDSRYNSLGVKVKEYLERLSQK